MSQAFDERIIRWRSDVVAAWAVLVQLGFAFAVGILMDTFLVRPPLPPAFAAWAGHTGRPGRALAGH
jgi:xanthosine utilization system XapX-like protein